MPLHDFRNRRRACPRRTRRRFCAAGWLHSAPSKSSPRMGLRSIALVAFLLWPRSARHSRRGVPGGPRTGRARSDRAHAPSGVRDDVLLRLAGSPRVVDPAWKRELLEEAWDRTHFIQEPYRRAAPGAPADSRAAMLTDAYDMKLDRVSLQARAARAMLALSPARAREMFEWIDFRAAAAVVRGTAGPGARRLLRHARRHRAPTFGTSFLERRPTRCRTSSSTCGRRHVQPRCCRLPRRSSATGRRRRGALSGDACCSGFSSTASPSRAASPPSGRRWSRRSAISMPGIAALGVRNATALRALRRYLVAQVSGPRCADSRRRTARSMVQPPRREPLGTRPHADFRLRVLGPSRILAPARLDRLWQTGESRRLRRRGRRARSATGRRRTQRPRRTPRTGRIARPCSCSISNDGTARANRSSPTTSTKKRCC